MTRCTWHDEIDPTVGCVLREGHEPLRGKLAHLPERDLIPPHTVRMPAVNIA